MYQFDQETRVEALGDGVFHGVVSDAWNIGDNPNGGYMVAIVMRAMSTMMPHPDPVSVTTHFLRPGTPEADCEVRVELIREGRTLSTLRGVLSQEGKERVVVMAAFANLAEPAGIDSDVMLAPPELPNPEDCLRRDPSLQGLTDIKLNSRVEVRLHPGQAVPGKAGVPEISGWIRFDDQRPVDTRTLLLFADAFPPSPFGLLGMVGWVPTIELTVHVRRIPADGWIKARFVTEDLREGRMIESGALWDSRGQLVAQSRQLGLVRSGG